MPKKLFLYGVQHSTNRLGREGHVRALFAKLKQLRKQGVTKIGFEQVEEVPSDRDERADFLTKGDSKRYWSRATRFARKLGMQVVDLRFSDAERAVNALDTALFEAIRQDVNDSAGWRKVSWLLSLGIQNSPKYLQRSKPVQALVPLMAEVENALPKITQQNIRLLRRAVIYHRSLRMRENALKAGLLHAVMGSAHAEDLSLEHSPQLVEVENLNEQPRWKSSTTAAHRKQAFEQMQDTVRHLVEFAEKTVK